MQFNALTTINEDNTSVIKLLTAERMRYSEVGHKKSEKGVFVFNIVVYMGLNGP